MKTLYVTRVHAIKVPDHCESLDDAMEYAFGDDDAVWEPLEDISIELEENGEEVT